MNSPLLGLDVGFKRTGVALSESGIIASPLTVLEADRPHMSRVIKEIIVLVRNHDIQTLVIGLPYTEDGEATDQSNKVERFINDLRGTLASEDLQPTLETVNEFYSSREAAELYPDAPLDAAAAALILQEYINQQTWTWSKKYC